MKILMQRLPGSMPDKAAFRSSLSLHRAKIILAVITVIGAVCGALLSRHADANLLEKLDFLLNSNYAQRAAAPSASVFLASAASTSLFLLACFLCGLAVWGMAVAPLFPFIRGVGLGMTGGYLLAAKGGWGALFYVAVLLPGAFSGCVSIILGTDNAMRFAQALRKNCFSNADEESPRFSRYIQRFGPALLLCFLGAALDTLLAAAFARYFPF